MPTILSDYKLALGVQETGDAADFPGSSMASERRLKHTANDVSGRLATGGTPNSPTHVVSGIVAADGTLDLTAAPKSGGGTQDLTGLKLMQLELYAPSDNAAAVEFGPGATSGYLFLGLAAGDAIELQPGQSLAFTFRSDKATAYAVVSGTANTMDFVVNSDELQYTLTFGATA
jgi:hypothetical protein